MNLPLAILAQMKDTFAVRLFVTVDGYGKRVYASASVSAKGRLDFKNRRVSNEAGEQIMSSFQVQMVDVTDMTNEAEITLPDGTTPKIRAFNRYTWPSGAKHIELSF